MDPVGFLVEPFSFTFMQLGLLAALVVGVVCAVVGSFVVLKGLAFIGDAVSHAAFPGLVIAYLLGLPLYLGAGVAAVATSLAIGAVSRRGGLRFDTAVGVLFAGTFAFGILLFSTIRNYVTDLMSYLFGYALGITVGDLVQVAVLGAIVLGTVLLLRKELLFATFDPAGAAASGLPVAFLEYLLLGLLGVTIVVSIQAVGIIMVVAMLVTPPATAQLLVVRFSRLMATAAAIAAVSVVVGLYLSYYVNVASGASIVLVETLAFLIALVAGPRSGLLSRRRATVSPA
ncbi:MAG: metal ABC transporter permease [Candidatus Limnocylindrales bacterium]